MAVSGGGIPAKRMGIYARQLKQVGLSHNVDALVVLTPEQAAVRIAAGESCYIESVGDAERRLQELLRAKGLVDAPMTTKEWLAWVRGQAR